jgi:hypothetical protein
MKSFITESRKETLKQIEDINKTLLLETLPNEAIAILMKEKEELVKLLIN